MENKLSSILEDYAEKDFARFHVPGHKGRGSRDFYKYDVTELPFTDDLNCPSGILKQAEEYASKIYKSRYSLFSVNGSSGAIMAAIMCCVGEGEKILLPSDSHISCYYGAMHAGAKISRLSLNDHICGISADELKNALNKEPDIKAVLVTSPTYFGCAANLKNISDILKERNIRMIVDEAHGAHLPFDECLPQSGQETGADVVIHSCHKTIGALTQTALVHVNCVDIEEADMRFYLKSVQSTSPSYILVNSVIDALCGMENAADCLKNLKTWYNNISERIKAFSKFELLNFGEFTDPLKVTVNSKVDMKDLEKLLYECGVVAEMYCGDIAVFALGFGSERNDCEKLISAFAKAQNVLKEKSNTVLPYKMPESKQALSINKARRSPMEWVRIDEAKGRISADFINVYPPGACAAIPGDELGGDLIEYILAAEEIHGAQDGKIRVLK